MLKHTLMRIASVAMTVACWTGQLDAQATTPTPTVTTSPESSSTPTTSITPSPSPTPALTPTPSEVTVREGQRTEIATSAGQIRVTAEAAPGRTDVKEIAGPPKRFSLLYVAPETAKVITETVGYSDTAAHVVNVTILPSSDHLYPEAAKILFVVFVIAVLLESGLAIIFNWRPFVVFFDGRGVRTLISVIVAAIFVSHYGLDLVTRLVNLYSEKQPPFTDAAVGYFITALVIAGGSAAVNQVMVALGLRSVKTAAEVVPQPPKTEGWISVTFVRLHAVGPVTVLIGDPALGPPSAGTIDGGKPLSPLVRLFVRDPNRFPRSGGFKVQAGTKCSVELKGKDSSGSDLPFKGKDSSGNDLLAPTGSKWGPETIAAGAIIDLTLKL